MKCKSKVLRGMKPCADIHVYVHAVLIPNCWLIIIMYTVIIYLCREQLEGRPPALHHIPIHLPCGVMTNHCTGPLGACF